MYCLYCLAGSDGVRVFDALSGRYMQKRGFLAFTATDLVGTPDMNMATKVNILLLYIHYTYSTLLNKYSAFRIHITQRAVITN